MMNNINFYQMRLIILSVLLFLIPGSQGFCNQIRNKTSKDKRLEYKIAIKDREILVAGYFANGLDKDLANILKRDKSIWNISLSSHGGLVNVAKKVAKIIQAHRLSTYTSTYCESACVIAFIAGSRRILGEHGKIGLHAYNYYILTKEEAKLVDREEKKYFKKFGLTDSFINKFFSIPINHLWYPTKSELIKNNIITHEIKNNKFYYLKVQSPPQELALQGSSFDINFAGYIKKNISIKDYPLKTDIPWGCRLGVKYKPGICINAVG